MPCANVYPDICGQQRPRSDCADTQSDQGLRCSHTESLAAKEFLIENKCPDETLRICRMMWICTFCAFSKVLFRLTLSIYNYVNAKLKGGILLFAVLSWMDTRSGVGFVPLLRKGFALKDDSESIFFPFRVDLFSDRDYCAENQTGSHIPVSIQLKSISDRYWPDRIPVGPITIRYRFKQNASEENGSQAFVRITETEQSLYRSIKKSSKIKSCDCALRLLTCGTTNMFLSHLAWKDLLTRNIGRVHFHSRYVRLCDLDIPREKSCGKIICKQRKPDLTLLSFWSPTD